MTRDEWRSIPTIAPYSWAIRRHGIIDKAEIIVGSDREEAWACLPDPPYELLALPHRQGMPEVTVELEPGDTPIWFKVRKQVYGVDSEGSLLEPLIFEYPVIGRRTPAGKEYVVTIFPDGEMAAHSSIADAIA